MIDVASSLALMAIIAVAATTFALASLRDGRRHFERVDREGESVLLRRGVMEMAHFGFEPIGRACARAGIGANAITAVSLALGAGAGLALALGHFGVAALLSAASASCDALDGMVARFTGTASDAGETFDAAVDRYNEFFFLAGFGVLVRADAWLLVATLGALLGSFMVSYATAKAEALRVTPPRGAMRRAERATYLTLGAALVPFTTLAAARLGASEAFGLAPMAAAVVLVAVVGNVSAARRLRAVAERVA